MSLLPFHPSEILQAEPPMRMIWSPYTHGLSVSSLQLWLVDRVGCELRLLRNRRAIEPWRKETSFGNLFQSCYEGWVKNGEQGLLKRQAEEVDKQIAINPESKDDIAQWAWLAQEMFRKGFLKKYSSEFRSVKRSEEHFKSDFTLPSGRVIRLHGYVDGEYDSMLKSTPLVGGSSGLCENKCRSDWDSDKLIEELPWDLQTNIYTLLYHAKHGKLPGTIWYQHVRRPGGFGFRGPRQKTGESIKDYHKRIVEHMQENLLDDYYFYRFWLRPTMTGLERFCWGCLYPMLESFLDWYEFLVHPDRDNQVNRHHWFHPYGVYNPFENGRPETFRNYRLTGSTAGLRRSHPDEERVEN